MIRGKMMSIFLVKGVSPFDNFTITLSKKFVKRFNPVF